LCNLVDDKTGCSFSGEWQAMTSFFFHAQKVLGSFHITVVATSIVLPHVTYICGAMHQNKKYEFNPSLIYMLMLTTMSLLLLFCKPEGMDLAQCWGASCTQLIGQQEE
jgi:hypothetical protein